MYILVNILLLNTTILINIYFNLYIENNLNMHIYIYI